MTAHFSFFSLSVVIGHGWDFSERLGCCSKQHSAHKVELCSSNSYMCMCICTCMYVCMCMSLLVCVCVWVRVSEETHELMRSSPYNKGKPGHGLLVFSSGSVLFTQPFALRLESSPGSCRGKHTYSCQVTGPVVLFISLVLHLSFYLYFMCSGVRSLL